MFFPCLQSAALNRSTMPRVASGPRAAVPFMSNEPAAVSELVVAPPPPPLPNPNPVKPKPLGFGEGVCTCARCMRRAGPIREDVE